MNRKNLVLMDTGMFCEGMHVKTSIYYLYKNSYVLLCKNVVLTNELITKLNNAAKGTNGVYIEEEYYRNVWDESLRQFSLNSQSYLREYNNVRHKYDDVLSKTVSFLGEASTSKGVPFQSAEDITDTIVADITQMDHTMILQCINMLYHADNYLYTHCVNVSALNGMVGKWIGLPSDDIKRLAKAGLLHDIGKLRVSPHILHKPGCLTGEEFEEIKRHPDYSYAMLIESGEKDPDLLKAVRQHHEKPNGTGYPLGLTSEDITLTARITSVCDVYDAMVSKRCYKDAFTPFEILAQFKENLFFDLDREIVGIFLDHIAYLLVGMRVKLSNGEEGEVVFVRPNDYANPIVKVGNRVFTTDDTCRCIYANRDT